MKEKRVWEESEMQLIRDEWAGGKTAAEIAAQLDGRTSNAVIGKIHRLGLPMRRTPSECQKPKKKAENKRAAVSHETVADSHVSAERYQPEETPANLVSLLDLKRGQCAWPFGDPKEPGFGFCGQACRQGSQYCAGHHRRAFQPTWRRSHDDERILGNLGTGK